MAGAAFGEQQHFRQSIAWPKCACFSVVAPQVAVPFLISFEDSRTYIHMHTHPEFSTRIVVFSNPQLTVQLLP